MTDNDSPQPPNKNIIQLDVSIKTPFKFEIIENNSEEQLLITKTRLLMGSQKQTASHALLYFGNFIRVRKLVRTDGKPVNVLGAFQLDKDVFLVGINFEVFKRLSPLARIQVFKGLVYRIPMGHIGSRFNKLVKKYGPQITELASMLSIDQNLDTAELAENSVTPPVPEFFNASRNKTIEDYCEFLAQKQNESHFFGPDGFAIPQGEKIKKQMPGSKNGKNKSPGDGEDNKDNGSGGGNQEDVFQPTFTSGGYTNMSVFVAGDGNVSDASLDATLKEVISKAMTAALKNGLDIKSRGLLPGEANEFIESLDEPAKVKWSVWLRNMHARYKTRERLVDKRRPPRRTCPIELPDGRVVEQYKGRKNKTTGVVMFVIDTSGSMGSEELQLVEPELRYMTNHGTRVMIMQVDAGVAKEPVEFRRFMRLNEFHGRGGTSFSPAFRHIDDMVVKPNFVVYFTDGYGEQMPPDAPIYPVLWVLTPKGMTVDQFRNSICEWGEVTKIELPL